MIDDLSIDWTVGSSSHWSNDSINEPLIRSLDHCIDASLLKSMIRSSIIDQ
jgi:hypothetical protein